MNGLPNVALYATPQALQAACEVLHRPRLCTTCQVYYTEASNLGSHKCFQHPGVPENGTWTCCNTPLLQPRLSQHYPTDAMFNISINVPPYPPPRQFRGCQPCDHTDACQIWTYENTIRLHDVSGIIPYLNKKQPVDERSGFAVTTIDSQTLPVVLRCAKQQIQLPNLRRLPNLHRASIRIHYLTIGGQPGVLEVPGKYNNKVKEMANKVKEMAKNVWGTTTSAFYVLEQPEQPEQLVQIYEFISV
jgi:hypothetical protein